MLAIIISLVIGAIAGWMAGKLMGKGMGLLVCIIVGVIGGFLGSWIFGLLGLAASETFWGRLLVGTLGAVVLLFILSLFRKK